MGKAGQGVNALLYACAAGVIKADDGCAILECQVLNLGYLLCVGSTKGAAKDSEVKGIDEDDAPVYLAIAADDAVAGNAFLLHSEVVASVHYVLIYLYK